MVAGPDGTVHRYHKIAPFTFGGEHKHFRAGGPFGQIEIEGVRIALFVCYDLRFADEFWALATGTDLYVVPANWPVSRREHWMSLLRARAAFCFCLIVTGKERRTCLPARASCMD